MPIDPRTGKYYLDQPTPLDISGRPLTIVGGRDPGDIDLPADPSIWSSRNISTITPDLSNFRSSGRSLNPQVPPVENGPGLKDIAIQGLRSLSDDGNFPYGSGPATTSSGRGIDLSGKVTLPPSPAAPTRSLPAQLRVPSAPDDSLGTSLNDVESDLTFDPSAHLTTPIEQAALAAARQRANFGPALAGLSGRQSSQLPPAPREPQQLDIMGRPLIGPSRNQAMVDRMRADLGMAPEAPGEAGVSQAQLEAEHGPHEAFAHMIEQMKAGAPVTAAGVTAKGQLAVEQAKEAGAREAEQQGYQHLQDFLSSGQAFPGTTISTPRGFTIRTAPPNQMVPAGVGGPAQQELDKARKDLADLPASGSVKGQYEEAKGLFSGLSLAQRRAALQQKIADLEKQLGIPPGATGAISTTSSQTAPAAGRQQIVLPSGKIVYREQ